MSETIEAPARPEFANYVGGQWRPSVSGCGAPTGKRRLAKTSVMAHASVAERARPRRSRFPFGNEGSASAAAPRPPLGAATGWASAREELVARR